MNLGEGKSGARVGRLFLALLIGISSILTITFLVGSVDVLKRVFSAKPLLVLELALVSLGVILTDSLRTILLTISIGKRIPFLRALENSILGFYVSAITPFSAGGQPFQIYHLTRLGLNVEEASMIVGLKFITSFSVNVVLGIVALSRYSDVIRGIPAVGPIMYFGITLTVAMYLFFLAMALGGRFTEVILSSKVISYPIAFFLRKKRAGIDRIIVEKVKSYTEMVRGFWKKSSLHFLLNVVLSTFMVILMLSTPYLAMESITDEHLAYSEVLGLQVAMNMVVYFLPTPGSSGGVEGMFYLVFSTLMESEDVASSLVIWRFFTYYTVIILGNFTLSRYLKERSR